MTGTYVIGRAPPELLLSLWRVHSLLTCSGIELTCIVFKSVAWSLYGLEQSCLYLLEGACPNFFPADSSKDKRTALLVFVSQGSSCFSDRTNRPVSHAQSSSSQPQPLHLPYILVYPPLRDGLLSFLSFYPSIPIHGVSSFHEKQNLRDLHLLKFPLG